MLSDYYGNDGMDKKLKVGDFVLADNRVPGHILVKVLDSDAVWAHCIILFPRGVTGYEFERWVVDHAGVRWPHIKLVSQTKEAALLEARLLGYGVGMKRVQG